MRQSAGADLLSCVCIQDAVEASAAGGVDGKQLRGMLHIVQASPGKDVLGGLIPAIVLGPHDMAVTAV